MKCHIFERKPIISFNLNLAYSIDLNIIHFLLYM